jgi:hypothetical protein
VGDQAFDHDDTRILFEVLFDIRSLLARPFVYVEGGDDDGEEVEEDEDDPRS